MKKEQESRLLDLSVGHRLMDAQHRRIVELRDEVADWARGPRKDSEEFHRLLNEVVEAMRTHIDDEERLLEKMGDPNLAAHKAEHVLEQEAILSIVCSAVSGVLDADRLVEMLTRKIEEHIRGADAQYGRLLADLRRGALAAAPRGAQKQLTDRAQFA